VRSPAPEVLAGHEQRAVRAVRTMHPGVARRLPRGGTGKPSGVWRLLATLQPCLHRVRRRICAGSARKGDPGTATADPQVAPQGPDDGRDRKALADEVVAAELWFRPSDKDEALTEGVHLLYADVGQGLPCDPRSGDGVRRVKVWRMAGWSLH